MLIYGGKKGNPAYFRNVNTLDVRVGGENISHGRTSRSRHGEKAKRAKKQLLITFF